ncbi:MAG: Glycosyltransferase [Parcubacteria group bacterium GW2011_GWA2_52_8]|nr:MAG: Glycosyltransferase [Parcubacteria group bacterium GW2011_GWA2_52_8]
MKLIFITRKIDRGDALTGFVFTWLAALAKNLDRLYVICQEKGDTSGLPANVEIRSFGKERGFGRLRQGYELFRLSYRFAGQAAGFFVHMHPIYAIIAWLPAKLRGRKVILWYTHKSVDFKLRLAHTLVDRVLTASPESFRLLSRKVKVVGHGIDLRKFAPLPNPLHQGEGRYNKRVSSPPRGGGEVGRRKFRIISIGRISPVKDYESLLKAVEILVNHKGVKDMMVEVYGRVGLPEHQGYLDSLIEFVHNADLEDCVKFQGELSYEFVDEILHEADLFINMSGTGSIDKAVLEAAAAGLLVISANEAFAEPLAKISPLFVVQRDEPEKLAEKILAIKSLNTGQKQSLREQLMPWVRKEHALENLVKKIIAEFKE